MINAPFNFTGNKYLLLDQILPLFDYSKNQFIDLFMGGGSVYINILDKYNHILVNDIIKDLVNIHIELINNPSVIINNVKLLATCKEDQQKYIELRNNYNKKGGPELLWALMLSCTNNMIRFNKKFEFNQTWGKRGWNDNIEKKVNMLLEHVDKYKEKIKFTSKNFYEVEIDEKSMIYCDPPYTNTEAGYNAYWNVELENRLYQYLIDRDKDGHSFALSGVIGEHKNNKKSDMIYKLISDGFKYVILDGNYEKVARNKDTKNSNEILIFNY